MAQERSVGKKVKIQDTPQLILSAKMMKNSQQTIPSKGGEHWGWLRLLAYVLSFFLAQILAGVLVEIYLMTTKGVSFIESDMQEYAVPFGVALLITNAAFIAFFFCVRLVRRTCLQNTTSGRGWALGIVGVVTIGMGLGFVLAPFDLSDSGTTEMFRQMLGNPWAVLSIVVVGPVFEELLCREGILRTLREKGLSVWVSIGVSSFFFAVVHGNIAQGVSAFVAGVYLGWLYERSGTALLPIVAHVLNNGLSVVMLYCFTIPIEDYVPTVVQIPLGIGLIAVGVVVAKAQPTKKTDPLPSSSQRGSIGVDVLSASEEQTDC